MAKRKFKPAGERTVLGFDFGSKSIGVAVGQEFTGTASPETALKARDGIPDWTQIQTLIDKWQPDLLVVGKPLNMDGSEQQLTFAARKFGNRLSAKFGIPVENQDERLSTADAKERLFEKGGYKNLSKGKVDNISAILILESWFEAQYQ